MRRMELKLGTVKNRELSYWLSWGKNKNDKCGRGCEKTDTLMLHWWSCELV